MVAASYQNLEFKHSFQTCSDSFSNSKNYWIPAEAKVIIEKDHQNSVALLALTKNSKDLGPIFTFFSNAGCWYTLYYLKSHNIFLQEIHGDIRLKRLSCFFVLAWSGNLRMHTTTLLTPAFVVHQKTIICLSLHFLRLIYGRVVVCQKILNSSKTHWIMSSRVPRVMTSYWGHNNVCSIIFKMSKIIEKMFYLLFLFFRALFLWEEAKKGGK